MIFHDIEQNSDEWLQLRAGKITSSNLGKIMANYGKAFGEPAKKYAADIAIEQITGKPAESGFSNDHMMRGHEQEPFARALYENETFSDVTNGGFFCDDQKGCSPDGMVGNDGEIEIKSVIRSVHYANVKRQSFDPVYKWQLIGNLLFAARDWIDFVSYCSGFPDGKKLYVFRVNHCDLDKEFAMIQSRTDEFLGLIETTKEIILNSDYFMSGK